MKIVYWVGGIIVLLIIAFYALNSYIYNEKQGDTSMQNTTVQVTPISHASLVLKWGNKVIFADPTGTPEMYANAGTPDLVLITHEHQDHFSTSTLVAVMGPHTTLVVPQSVADKLPVELKTNLVVMKNNEVQQFDGLTVQAVPAYNLRADALQYHPKGRDNGYVLEGGDNRVYIAGDTEDTPEMRALQDIDIAFVPMNLPYTMSVEQAAAGVLAFKPTQVYPYHYRNSDVAKFTQLVNAGDPNIEVVLANWYPQAEGR